MSNGSSSFAPVPAYEEWINRGEYVASGLLQLGALPLLAMLLFGHCLRPQMLTVQGGLAASLLIYLAASLLFVVPSIVYNGYMLYAWLFNSARFDPDWMFWTGLWSVGATCVLYNATLFLTLDRCATLVWPFAYPARRAQRALIALDAASCAAIFCIVIWSTLRLELPLDRGAASKCLNHPCTATKSHYKYPVLACTLQGCVNLGVGLLFFVLLRKKADSNLGQNSATRLRNRVVTMTIVFEIVFKIVPSLTTYLINNLTGLLISAYAGWLLMLVSSIDTFCICVCYALVLTKNSFVVKGASSTQQKFAPKTVP